MKVTTIFFFFSLLLTGCVSVKPSASKSGRNAFQVFYIGDSGNQYFIKPIVFTNETSAEQIKLDVTFKYKDDVKDSSTVNFSILSSSLYKKIDSLVINTPHSQVASKQVQLLFNEKTEKHFVSRFTTKVSLHELKELFAYENWQISLHEKEKRVTFKPEKKATNTIKEINNLVFILMQ